MVIAKFFQLIDSIFQNNRFIHYHFFWFSKTLKFQIIRGSSLQLWTRLRPRFEIRFDLDEAIDRPWTLTFEFNNEIILQITTSLYIICNILIFCLIKVCSLLISTFYFSASFLRYFKAKALQFLHHFLVNFSLLLLNWSYTPIISTFPVSILVVNKHFQIKFSHRNLPGTGSDS